MAGITRARQASDGGVQRITVTVELGIEDTRGLDCTAANP
jgi:hypothetical protein